MTTVLDGIAWAEAHPMAAAVIGALGLAALGLAFLLFRIVWLAVRFLSRRYVIPRPVEDVLTIVAASIATAVSAQGMWLFSGDVLSLGGPLRLLLFAFIEVAIITSAVRARRNMRENFTAGLDGMAVWALTCLTAVLSSMDANGLPEAMFRLAAPLVAAWLWERGMAIERHRIRGTGRINWRLTPERVLVRVGLAETRDRTAQEVDAHRRITRVALAAKKAKALREHAAPERKVRAALAKLDRAMDQAVEHTGLASDPARQEALLAQIAALYNTAALIDAELVPPWQSAKETPVPAEALEAIREIARAEGRAEGRRHMPIVPLSVPQQRTGDIAAGRPVPSLTTPVPLPYPRKEPVSSPAHRGGGTGTKGASPPSNTEDRPRPSVGTKQGTVPRPRRGRARGRAGDRPPEWDSVDDLMPLGWRIVADFQKSGTNLTRDTLRDAIRATGTRVSTTRATTLLQRLRAEAPAEPNLRTNDGDRTRGTSGPSPAAIEDETRTNGCPSPGDEQASPPPAIEDATGTDPGSVPQNDTTGDTE